MVYSRLFLYAILAILLAAFATFLAQRRPRGHQPATFGHLQVLADLVDDWGTDEKGRMWWGDKTGPDEPDEPDGVDAVRHAGTSRDKALLAPIRLESRYAGCVQRL
ncbi:hypothetical protein CDD83_971 [Cordyceps sp. RAO-2017]|nr:hypothetical protein CDD83_971 [Cordyceps sp. RAO-2017]